MSETEEVTLKKSVKVIKADFLLKAKIGAVRFDDHAVSQCQSILDNNEIDFTPYAKEIFNELDIAITHAKNNTNERSESKKSLIVPVMKLKANAPMFQYDLIGNLANIMLNFLENIPSLDNHAIEIVSAHRKTLSLIIDRKIKGDGGEIGDNFGTELKSACNRYYKITPKK